MGIRTFRAAARPVITSGAAASSVRATRRIWAMASGYPMQKCGPAPNHRRRSSGGCGRSRSNGPCARQQLCVAIRTRSPGRTRTPPAVAGRCTLRSMTGVGVVTRMASSTARSSRAASPATRSSCPWSARSAIRRGSSVATVSVPVRKNAPAAPRASSSDRPRARIRPMTVASSPPGRTSPRCRRAGRGPRGRAAPGTATAGASAATPSTRPARPARTARGRRPRCRLRGR